MQLSITAIEMEIEKLTRYEQLELIKAILARHQLEDLADRKRPFFVRNNCG